MYSMDQSNVVDVVSVPAAKRSTMILNSEFAENKTYDFRYQKQAIIYFMTQKDKCARSKIF